MCVSDRISRLRDWMKKEQIDICVVPTADYHNSEYVGEYFKFRQYLTGFTGSAGTAVVTMEEACLWTDGRYFIQAEDELRGTEIHLFRMGEPGVPSLSEYMERSLPEGGVIGFDGRTVELAESKCYERCAKRRGGSIRFSCDPAAAVWINRPELPNSPAFFLEQTYTGESMKEKLFRIRGKMEENRADVHLISSLDDIAWILNIRGNDIAYCPLVLAYLIVWMDHADLFVDQNKFSEDMRTLFSENHIVLHPYGDVYEAVEKIRASHTILIDPARISCALFGKIGKQVKIVEKENPSVRMKCRKNDTEAEHIRKAHIKDGIAHTRFLYWIKKNIGKIPMTELSVSEKLQQFRAEQEGYLGPSFEPISAFGSHGAIVHYSPSSNTDRKLEPGQLILMDTGGHYMEGSTDITRTIALGNIPRKQKEDFTLVARAMLKLSDTVFLHGCSGKTLDCIARNVFWKERVNFNHGTGHGVGYLMNIHEDPIRFQWKDSSTLSCPFEKNMVITDEPGIYVEGSHGIRLENELIVQEDEKNQYGQFMCFQTLTWVPIDLDAILPDMMSQEEKELLNHYHRNVFRIIGPHLCEEEREWLKTYTRPV